MPIPNPEPGLVISYAYLWHHEHSRNAERHQIGLVGDIIPDSRATSPGISILFRRPAEIQGSGASSILSLPIATETGKLPSLTPGLTHWALCG
jgi:hypothetical protein